MSSNNKVENRVLFELHSAGKSYDELGEMYGMSNEAVRGRIRRHRANVEKRAERNGVDVAEQTYIEQQASRFGALPDTIKGGWLKTKFDDDGKGVSLKFWNTGVNLEAWREELLDEMRQHAPKYPEIVRAPSNEPHLMYVRLCDIHAGALADSLETGEDYDSSIAQSRVREGLASLIHKTAGFNISQTLLVTGDDLLQTDGVHRTTTKGTSVDVSEMWYRSFYVGRKIIVDTIETLLNVSDIHYQHIAGNHDKAASFFLSNNVQAWFRNCPNITFEVDPRERKAYLYGKSFIGSTHGHARMNDTKLALVMAKEFKEFWSKAEYEYIYKAHLHSKHASDQVGVTVETVRSPKATDSYEHTNAHISIAGMEVYLHSLDGGEIGRFTHNF